MADYDVVTIGAGHNGLAANTLLSQRGLKTLNVEKTSVVGGHASCMEFWPGYRHNIGAWVYMLQTKKLKDALEVEKYGMELVEPSISTVTLGAQGEDPLVFYTDMEKFFTTATASYGSDAVAGLVKMMTFFQTAGAGIGIAMQNQPVSLFKLLDMLPSIEAKDELRRAIFGSCKDIVDEFWPLTDGAKVNTLRAWMAATSVDGQYFGPMSPGSCLVLLYHMSQGGEHGGYQLVKGGMQNFSEAIKKNLEAHGGEVTLNSPVKRVLIKEGKAYGVELESGEEITAKIVLCNTDFRYTFNHLVAPEELPNGFLTRVDRIKHENPYIQVYLKMNGAPHYGYQYEYLNDIPDANWLTGYVPSLEYVERCWDACKYGEIPTDPFPSLGIHSLIDPTLAPEGKHVGIMYNMFFPTDIPENKQAELKKKYAERCFEIMTEKVYPDFMDCIDDYVVWSNKDMERQFNSTNGDYDLGNPEIQQMLDWRPMMGFSDYRTPIKGLYNCGSSGHPTGGVTAIPAMNCVEEVLKDWEA